MNVLAVMVSLCAAAAVLPPDSGKRPPLSTVDHVDLQLYAGRWFEIARYPNPFQRDCQSDVTALYTLQKNGKVEVVNSCRKKNGKIKTARGTAKIADPSNAKLRVTFFWPFYGDYWIIGLDPDYRWAVVGEPRRRYLWILSRDPRMPLPEYDKVLDVVRSHGYDPDQLVQTPQSDQP
ncbi:MAG TPA: lipocalin family protein [Candidatus Limnocylindrales bacterium]|nr:lipocalin family protein [Candidatus Limnocylindrales bacterium]